MRIVATIFVIFLVQCAYLRAEPILELKKVGKFLGSNSCIFGVESVSTYLYNSTSKGDTIEVKEICNNINSGQPIAFVIHGFVTSANATSLRELDIELAQKNYTVFAVDWSQGACTNGIPFVNLLEYPFAVNNTREIGHYVARSVETLLKCNVSLKNITFIGHSLGAHICGFAAKEVQTWGHGNISRIIAADPAAPLFNINNCPNRLCKTDADYITVLHTSTPLGIQGPLGHLDLMFNGGQIQPGCDIIKVNCSHGRSVDYLNSILKNNCGFPGVSIKTLGSFQELDSPKLGPFQKLGFPKLGLFQMPPTYPSSNTTDCIFVDSNILDNQCSIKGSFYVFVEEKEPYCTQNTFNCNSNC